MAALFQSLAQAKRLSLLAVLSLFCWGLTLPAKAVCPNATAFGNGFERQLKEEQPTPGEDACTGVWLVFDGEGRIGLFVGNNPLRHVDPYGLTWALFSSDAWWQLLSDIFMGNRPPTVVDPNSFIAQHGVDNNFNGQTAGQVVADIGKAVPEGILTAAMMLGGEGEAEGAYQAADKALKAAKNCPKIDPNKLRHIFDNARHDLGGLLSQFKSQEEAFAAIQGATEAAVQQQKLTGIFETTVQVGGQAITVRGNVVNGVVQIGTAFK